MEASKQFLLSTFLNSEEEHFHLARTTITSSTDLHLHHHDYAEIFWIKDGEGIHLINGISLPISKGSLFIIRPEDSHTFKLTKSNQHLVITNLAFRKSYLEFYKTRYFAYAKTFFPPESEQPFSIKLSSTVLSMFSAQADQLFAEPRDIIHLDMMIIFIFHALHEHVSINKSIPHWLSHALEQYSSPVQYAKGISGFVELTMKSNDHVNRVVRKVLNQSLTETANKARLNYAAGQLIMTNSPIKTIASECGFATVNYFHRIFKLQYGVTPVEYRNKNTKII